MHDIKIIRDDPKGFDKALARRKHPAVAEGILAIDEQLRKVMTEFQQLQSRRNEAAKKVGELKAKGQNADDVIAEVATLKAKSQELEGLQQKLSDDLQTKMAPLPNILYDDVPDGVDEKGNKLLKEWGDIPKFSFPVKQHFEIGEALGQMDFERAARISGTRFVFLKGDLAKLNRALGQYFLDTVSKKGFTEVVPPLMVKNNAVYGVGQLPKFEEDLFKTTTGMYLISTSEATLTNYYHDEIIEEEVLPVRMAALTPCFRSEAGSAGKDTRGMIRLHQFDKVEIVSIVHPDKSRDEHEFMASLEEEILQSLKLPYRKMLLCAGDTGGVMHKTYDMEVWLPGQNSYREVSSCSSAGEYQARRMNTRFRCKQDKKTKFVHTLNGSALPIGRTLVAILENFQQADGSVKMPDVLVPYMGGQEIIKATK